MGLPGALMLPDVTAPGAIGFGGYPGFGLTLGFPQTPGTWYWWPSPFFPGANQGVGTLGMWDGRNGGIEVSGHLDTAFGADFGEFYFTSLGRFWEARWKGATAQAVPSPFCPGDASIQLFTDNIAPEFAAIFGGNACQSYIGTFSTPGATGNQSITGVGFEDLGAGTAPDLIIFLGSAIAGISGCCDESYGFSHGAMDAAGNQWCVSAKTIPGTGWTFFGGICNQLIRFGGFFADRVLYLDGAPACAQTSFTAPLAFPYDPIEAKFVSMDSDGFTLDWTQVDTTGGSHLPWAFLALKADPGRGQFAVGTLTQPTTSVAVGFDPDAVWVAGQGCDPTDIDCGISAYWGVGATDGVSQRSSFTGARGNHPGDGPAGPIQTATYYGDSLISGGDPHNEILLYEAVGSLVPGGFDLSWTTDDGKAREFGWIAWQLESDPVADPVVTTLPAAILGATSAEIKGSIIPNSGDVTVEYLFFWKLHTSGVWNTTALTPDGSGSGLTLVSAVLTGLTPNVLYDYYLEVRVNGLGHSHKGGYGNVCVVDGEVLQFMPMSAPVLHSRFRAGSGEGQENWLVADASAGGEAFIYLYTPALTEIFVECDVWACPNLLGTVTTPPPFDWFELYDLYGDGGLTPVAPPSDFLLGDPGAGLYAINTGLGGGSPGAPNWASTDVGVISDGPVDSGPIRAGVHNLKLHLDIATMTWLYIIDGVTYDYSGASFIPGVFSQIDAISFGAVHWFPPHPGALDLRISSVTNIVVSTSGFGGGEIIADDFSSGSISPAWSGTFGGPVYVNAAPVCAAVPAVVSPAVLHSQFRTG